jgi:predicted  nucleic acid-binding Zn-ribbon protein
MAKTWEQLTQPEKVEDLRQDVKRIFDALRSLSSDLDRLQNRLSEVSEKRHSPESNTKGARPKLD